MRGAYRKSLLEVSSAVLAALDDVRNGIAEGGVGAGDAPGGGPRDPLSIGAEAHLFRAAEGTGLSFAGTGGVEVARDLTGLSNVGDGVAAERAIGAGHTAGDDAVAVLA